jgi:5-methyltetrahydropteroyltriglutamate--homocysteine methyltransferase
MPEKLLPTTVVGSYPQPDWLVNRETLSKVVPRIRMREIWRISEPYLEQAQDDATIVAIRDMEREGIDVITDGEMRRESYSNYFATALEGIDIANPGQVKSRAGDMTRVPRVVGRSVGHIRSKCATCSFCVATPIVRRRSRCPVRSP